MGWTLPDPEAEKRIYAGLQADLAAVKTAYDEAEQSLRLFIINRAFRQNPKPWEICGAEDAWRPRHKEGHPDYDEDDLVAGVQCQLPKGHESRWHEEWSEDGKLLGEWSG